MKGLFQARKFPSRSEIVAALRISGPEIGVWLAAAGVALAFEFLLLRYLQAEKTFIYWDSAMYHLRALELARVMAGGVGQAAKFLANSLGEDYTLLFAVPSASVLPHFGGQRQAFILVNFIVYGLGFVAALAMILRRWTGMTGGRSFLLMLFVVAAMPFVWVPLAQGFPDLGGTLVMTVAVALALADMDKPHWLRGVAIGLCLALAFFFRRPFAYAVVAFLLTYGAFVVGQVFAGWRCGRGRRLGHGLVRLILPVAIVSGLVRWLAPRVFDGALSGGFGQLYTSYAEPIASLLDTQLLFIGPLLLWGGVVGMMVFAFCEPARRRDGGFLLGLAGVWSVLWFGVVRYGGTHYLLHILPIVLALGWAVGLVAIGRLVQGAVRRRVVVGGVALVLALNGAMGFWAADVFNLDARQRWFMKGLFSAPVPPERRKDYDEILGLVNYLHAMTSQQDRIAVLASSQILNQDLLGAADLVRAEGMEGLRYRLPIIPMPEVDRRDPLPLDAFAQANVFVLATPPQFHLAPDAQNVMAASIATVMEKIGPFKEILHRDEPVFHLRDGVEVTVWRLTRPLTPAELGELVTILRNRTLASGSLPQDWVLQRSGFSGRLVTESGNRTLFQGMVGLSSRDEPTRLFFSLPLPPALYHVAGRIGFEKAACVGVRRGLAVMTGDGKEIVRRDEVVVPDTGALFAETFDLTGHAGADHYLVLTLRGGQGERMPPCAVTLTDLRVEREDGR